MICIVGDGGAQFSLSELMVARDEALPITFVIWNSRGYREIDMSMRAVGVSVVGCDPTPPDFAAIAAACGMPHSICTAADPAGFAAALAEARHHTGPTLIEIDAPYAPQQD